MSEASSPRVSVILPTWNRVATLGRAMASVLDQTWHDLELIVVDDGSDDGTDALIAGFSDPRVRCVRTGGRTGVSRARNLGVAHARGELIAFQDSDDEWLASKLERQVAAMGSDAVLVLCGDEVVNAPWMSYLGVDSPEAVVNLGTQVNLRIPGANTFLLRKAVFDAIGGFDVVLNCFEDWDLALRLSDHGPVLMVNFPLVLRKRMPGSLFADETGHARNLRRILDKNRRRLSAHPEAWAHYSNLIGQAECRFGDLREGRDWFIRAVRSDPRSLRAWVNLGASLLGSRMFRCYVDCARRIRAQFAAPVRPTLYQED